MLMAGLVLNHSRDSRAIPSNSVGQHKEFVGQNKESMGQNIEFVGQNKQFVGQNKQSVGQNFGNLWAKIKSHGPK